MVIDILTVHPSLLEGFFSHSILQRAAVKELVEIHIHNLREFTTTRYKSVDDYQYGGGAGMVMTAPPLSMAIEALSRRRKYDEVIFMTPDGTRFTQGVANELSLATNLLIICGHYKGIDERIRKLYVTREISVGDYVLSGGEIPAALVTDATCRLIPGVLGDESSALTDSFQDGLLAPPVYTRPEEFMGEKVPAILLSGNSQAIENWRFEASMEKTRRLRPDLLE